MNNVDIFKTIAVLPKMPTVPYIQVNEEFLNACKISTDYINPFISELNQINTLVNTQIKATEPIFSVMKITEQMFSVIQALENTQFNELMKINSAFTETFQQILDSINYDKLYKIFERINQKQYENESIDDIVAEISQDYTEEELQIMQEDCFLTIDEFNEYILTYIKTAIDVASEDERTIIITIAEKITSLSCTENKAQVIVFLILYLYCYLKGILRSANEKMLSDDI